MAFAVVPFEGDATIEFTSPIFFDFIVCAERSNEVVGMFFADIFDPKIIYSEGELHRSCDVFP